MTTDKTPATLATVKHGGCVRLGTPGSRWAASGEPDPNGTRYDCERAALVMGDLTDDELANAVFMHGNERQTMADLVGGATPAIAYLTAAKDRIRWLSRALAAAESLSAQPSPGGQGEELDLDRVLSLADVHAEESREDGVRLLDRGGLLAFAQDVAAALAARQPVGNEPAFYLSAGAWGHIRVPMTPTRDVKAFRHGFDHGDTELVPFYAAPPAQQSAQAVDLRKIIEQIAQQWDGCNYDAVGETIDIGPAIRAAGKRLVDSNAAQAVDLGAAIKAAFPLLTNYGLHHSHCCEYKLIDERHRLHNLIDSHAEVRRG
ncbi:hypothetical protein [Xanthomonas retroflexus]|uniref:hypothetical protein n=1 Tax=Stenotrophomonas indicatrix TaxID=2045451 RepID=UPI000B449B55